MSFATDMNDTESFLRDTSKVKSHLQVNYFDNNFNFYYRASYRSYFANNCSSYWQQSVGLQTKISDEISLSAAINNVFNCVDYLPYS